MQILTFIGSIELDKPIASRQSTKNDKDVHHNQKFNKNCKVIKRKGWSARWQMVKHAA